MMRTGKKFSIHPRLLNSEPMQRCTLDSCCGACCLYGVWLDREEAEEILQNAALISPHMKPEFSPPEMWFEGSMEQDPYSHSGEVMHSRVVEDPTHYGDTACIFLRGDHKCSLQVASLENGFHPWHFKPFYCILHPLDISDDGLITLDETECLLAEQASCLRPANKSTPLLETFAPELKFFLGETGYAEILCKWTRNEE